LLKTGKVDKVDTGGMKWHRSVLKVALIVDWFKRTKNEECLWMKTDCPRRSISATIGSRSDERNIQKLTKNKQKISKKY
jgi:hypothetical protein